MSYLATTARLIAERLSVN